MDKRNFNGFDKEAINFLLALSENNFKEWFEDNTNIFKNHVMGPLQRLVMNLGETMIKIDPLLDVTPVTNKTISRIYRDTRFSTKRICGLPLREHRII